MHIEETLVKLNIYIIFIKDDELLERYNEIYKKVRNSIKKEFDSEPVYNKQYLYQNLFYQNFLYQNDLYQNHQKRFPL